MSVLPMAPCIFAMQLLKSGPEQTLDMDDENLLQASSIQGRPGTRLKSCFGSLRDCMLLQAGFQCI